MQTLFETQDATPALFEAPALREGCEAGSWKKRRGQKFSSWESCPESAVEGGYCGAHAALARHLGGCES